MKKLMIVSAIAISGLMVQNANAQIGLHFNVNLGPRPVYVQQAPVYNDAAFYYLPDVGAYYSVNEGCYYYQDGGAWVTAAYLPGVYRDYDWRNARHFAVNEPRPYLHNDFYVNRYSGFNGRYNWNYRDGYNTRVYADRAHFDNNPYRGDEHVRNFEQHDDRLQYQSRDSRQYENRDSRLQQGPSYNNHNNERTKPQYNNRGEHEAEGEKRGGF
jgi:hypothetical protein